MAKVLARFVPQPLVDRREPDRGLLRHAVRYRVRVKARDLRARLRKIRKSFTRLLGGEFLQGSMLLQADAFFRDDGIHWDIVELGKD